MYFRWLLVMHLHRIVSFEMDWLCFNIVLIIIIVRLSLLFVVYNYSSQHSFLDQIGIWQIKFKMDSVLNEFVFVLFQWSTYFNYLSLLSLTPTMICHPNKYFTQHVILKFMDLTLLVIVISKSQDLLLNESL